MPLTPRDKRALTIFGAVAALAVVVFLLTTVLGGGEEEAPVPAAQGEQPAPEVSPTATPRETPPPVRVVSGRDPFSPPPTLAGPGGGGSPGETTSPPTSPPPTSPPPTSPPPTSPPPTGGKGGSTTTAGGQDVSLLSIFTRHGKQMASVEVDGTVYTVEEGEQFAKNLQLVSISGSCARFLFGDDGFTLCERPETK